MDHRKKLVVAFNVLLEAEGDYPLAVKTGDDSVASAESALEAAVVRRESLIKKAEDTIAAARKEVTRVIKACGLDSGNFICHGRFYKVVGDEITEQSLGAKLTVVDESIPGNLLHIEPEKVN